MTHNDFCCLFITICPLVVGVFFVIAMYSLDVVVVLTFTQNHFYNNRTAITILLAWNLTVILTPISLMA